MLGEANRLEVTREKCLSQAAEASEPDVQELSRLSAQSEVYAHKLSRAAAQIADAEQKLQTEVSAVLARFQTLQRWALEREKAQLADSLTPGASSSPTSPR